jgi:hypothetical protein
MSTGACSKEKDCDAKRTGKELTRYNCFSLFNHLNQEMIARYDQTS